MRKVESWAGLVAVSVLLVAAGCNSSPSPASSPTAAVGPEVLATVNGTRITEADLELKLKTDMHQTDMRPEHRANVLEAVIRDEVLSQKAIADGLDNDPKYLAGLRSLEAQVAAYKRRELSERYLSHLAATSPVTEADARKYFDGHATELRTDLHLWQILQRDEAAITRAHEAIDKGTPFEEVARSLLPNVPATEAPWDLGYMKWLQMPEAWRPVLEKLKPGETSAVIRGPRGRFWILKLVDKRESPAFTFENIQPVLMEFLKNTRLAEVREAAERDLRARAKVVYLKK